MLEYHKIQTCWLRDPETNHKTLLPYAWAKPEFEYLQNNEWHFTEKVDGTNIRVMMDFEESTLKFGGKTDAAQIPATLINRLNDRFDSLGRCSEVFKEAKQVCLYGEGYGAKIQKGGGNYRPDQDFVLFDVYIDGWWLRRPDIEAVAKGLGIDVVPVIGRGNLHHMINQVEHGFNSVWGNFQAEGIVARPAVELKSRNGERIITKLKYKDFLHVQ